MVLSPEYVERINKATEAWRRARSQSSGASIGFHEKLAVLTAGSLALAVSGAGALYQKPLTNSFAMHWLFCSLTASAACLWLSLVASVAHNFLETYAISIDAKVDFLESEFQIFEAFFTLTKEQTKELNAIDPHAIAHAEGEVARLRSESTESTAKWAERLRKCELPLSIAAILLFVLGYLSVVGYVVVLARSVG
jgi:hypothetical protein